MAVLARWVALGRVISGQAGHLIVQLPRGQDCQPSRHLVRFLSREIRCANVCQQVNQAFVGEQEFRLGVEVVGDPADFGSLEAAVEVAGALAGRVRPLALASGRNVRVAPLLWLLSILGDLLTW